MLARRLLCFNGECAVRDALRLGTSALSRRHLFKNSSATLAAHSNCVDSAAFHPTPPLLATIFYFSFLLHMNCTAFPQLHGIPPSTLQICSLMQLLQKM
jgi:hypothetical protein